MDSDARWKAQHFRKAHPDKAGPNTRNGTINETAKNKQKTAKFVCYHQTHEIQFSVCIWVRTAHWRLQQEIWLKSSRKNCRFCSCN